MQLFINDLWIHVFHWQSCRGCGYDIARRVLESLNLIPTVLSLNWHEKQDIDLLIPSNSSFA